MYAVSLVPALAEDLLSRVRALAYLLALPALALLAPRAELSRGALALAGLTLLTCALSAFVPAVRSVRGQALPRATGWVAPFADLAALAGAHLLLARAAPPGLDVEPLVLVSLVAGAVLVVASAGLRASALLALLCTLAGGAALLAYVRLHPGTGRTACLVAVALAGACAFGLARLVRRAAAQTALARVLPGAGALRVAREPSLLAAEGTRLEATVLFAELRGLSAWAGEREPDEVIRLMRRLRTLLAAAIHEDGGSLLEVTGDGVLAVFGAPEPAPGDARAALHAAAALVRHVRALAISEDLPLSVGVGLHRGRLVAGDMGAEGLLQYALVGDVVSIARRLESLTNEVKVEVILSADVSAALDAPAPLRALGPVRVAGRSRSVEAFAWEEAPSDPAASLLTVPR
ncbi:adenylate/guanylate cyclase domain-containing protein [Aggregicoccus sp. 17bor-14]|uniref:adenylate/guanylate cyclase domain-containing protein n=1 Tax=Myxococcaceae TaxID=31 RepID=UPI00129C77D9|nr:MULTISPECIES: adenylate/guanylate cyclase domain-containing protein [Myxococcaceae]MBF5044021.1 adenylate/guanylate cyclase domain-containing protein [Simulacricoccus sp. 17bor-14]MRI89772.1 adenylate/guanylate cyclase domain-containing protein [Aggregicoccus sp. 17bor-14]